MPIRLPKYQTYKKNVKLKPSQTLGFQSGKGYYAKPAKGVPWMGAVPKPALRPAVAPGVAPYGETYQPGPYAPTPGAPPGSPAATPAPPQPGTVTPATPATPPPLAPPPTPGPLQWNPQLPMHPLGAFGDAEYYAQEAALRNELVGNYQSALKKLGYIGPDGTFVPGTIEVGAQARRGEIGREMGLAEEAVTNEARGGGTLFSSVRAVEQARRQNPLVEELSKMNIDIPQQLSQALSEARGFLTEYELKRNELLAEAAGRAPLGTGADEGDWESLIEPAAPAPKPTVVAKPPAKKPIGKLPPKKPAKKPPAPKKKTKPKPKFTG